MNIYRIPVACLMLLSLAVTSVARDKGFVISPYLQLAETDSITVMWKLPAEVPTVVEWGAEKTLGGVQSAVLVPNQKEALYHARISGLKPNTLYYYRVKAGAVRSAVYHFRTPALQQDEAPIRVLVTSDVQNGAKVFKSKVFPKGIKVWAEKHYKGDLAESFDLLMFPGDLVQRGNNIAEWNQFFDAMHPLLAHVPMYSVHGNHEYNHPNYLNHMTLPPNGDAQYAEHWWYKDYSNLRIIGLDSNYVGNNPKGKRQLAWLTALLKKTEKDPLLDFVALQLHHPHESELWPDGNHPYSGQVIEMLGDFTKASGKPNIIFYGHTHGYSRGQGKDHGHVMVNVGGGGGHLDKWNGYKNQFDYDAYTVSKSEYGFAVTHVTAGDNPTLTMNWYGGTGETFSLSDSITLRRYNKAPAVPEVPAAVALQRAAPEEMVMMIEGYKDPDSDPQSQTHWQIAEDPDFKMVIEDRWVAVKNIYKGKDLNEGIEINRLPVPVLNLTAGKTYYWRARVRDASLAWSPWTTPSKLIPTPTKATDLLKAAAGKWTGKANFADKENVVSIHQSGRISKGIDLPKHVSGGRIYYGAGLIGGSRHRISLIVQFLDAAGKVIGEAAPAETIGRALHAAREISVVPKGTRRLNMILDSGAAGGKGRRRPSVVMKDLYLYWVK